MADFFSLPVYNSLRVFYKDLCLHTNKMSRPDRYELVMPLCKEIEKMMTLVAKANDADDKHEFLKNGIDTIDEVKIHIRNLYELSFIRVKGFSVLCDHAESISRQLNGWYKSLNNK